MATNYPVNPRIRAFGKARIDIAQRAKSREDWERLWKRPSHTFPFVWGEAWKQCIEYKVDDFAAEVGFFIDVLGLPINAFDPNYAMFTSPHGDFFFAVVPTPEAENPTPPDAFRLQFMVADILDTTKELEGRGIEFEQQPQPCQVGSSLYIGYFRTPHGIPVDLWGMVKAPKPAGEDDDFDEEEADLDEDEDEDDDLEGDAGEDEFDEDDDLDEDEDDDDDEDEFRPPKKSQALPKLNLPQSRKEVVDIVEQAKAEEEDANDPSYVDLDAA
jgi:catechol 2,3-dioxygenase-like lactoylglutathione lyase family enzyme